ncbi:hypothetical protein [Pelagicoccus mobilis]|uniref:Uncharacterized protein n=1 Tax=Pelagicoccus mobilis TaxID=415221 RepID=A0A934S267_9BACT|nr:hypothetical protein [Pelagicoccus mobilis]MBK1880513.1 hypothetical protein [Pelagicoccus mobilis]
MITTLRTIAWLGLVLTLLPSILFFFDAISLENLKTAMTAGMILWLVFSPLVQKAKTKLVNDLR